MTTINENNSSKKVKIIYWVSTGLIALFVLPGVFFLNSPIAIEGIKHLGLPEWFRWEVGIGQPIGAILLILPMVGKRLKEWAYVALGIVYVSAFIAHLVVDGVKADSFMPLVTLGILGTSYIYYHKMNK
jgi:hypothetical protein